MYSSIFKATGAAVLFSAGLSMIPNMASATAAEQVENQGDSPEALDSMELRLEQMGEKLESLSTDLEGTSSESKELVEEALNIIRAQRAEYVENKAKEASSDAATSQQPMTQTAITTANGSTTLTVKVGDSPQEVVVITSEPPSQDIDTLMENLRDQAEANIKGLQQLPPDTAKAIMQNVVQDFGHELQALHRESKEIKPSQITGIIEQHLKMIERGVVSANFDLAQNSKDVRQIESEMRRVEHEVRRLEGEQRREEAQVLRSQRIAQRNAQRSRSESIDRAVFSGNAVVGPGEVVKEFVLFSGNGEVKGVVEGDAVLLAGNLLVRKGAVIEGDAVVLAGNLSVESGAVIGGDTVVTAGKLVVEEGADVSGDQVQMALSPWNVPALKRHRSNFKVNFDDFDDEDYGEGYEQDDEEDFAAAASLSDDNHSVMDSAQSVFSRFLLLCASGLLLMTFLPARTRMVGRTIQNRLGASVVTGTLATFSILPISALLLASLVGIPLLACLYVGIAFAAIMGTVAFAMQMGRHLPIQNRIPAWLLVGGSGAMALITEIPVLGAVATVGIGFAGLGAVLLSRFGESPHQSQA